MEDDESPAEITEAWRKNAELSFKVCGLPKPSDRRIRLWAGYVDAGNDFRAAAMCAFLYDSEST